MHISDSLIPPVCISLWPGGKEVSGSPEVRINEGVFFFYWRGL